MTKTIQAEKKIELTGDPFVNTGLAVLSYLAGHKSIENLTLSDIKRVYGDGKDLSRINTMSSCAFSLFPNSLLTHNSRRRDMTQLTKTYNEMTDALLKNIGKEDINHLCEVCGNPKSLFPNVLSIKRKLEINIDPNDRSYKRSVSSRNSKKGKSTVEPRYFGRDWFPLLGSMQKDAQALPGASRPFHVCATCLFAVQYLPQGVFSVFINGKSRLAIYQCTSIPFWYRLVADVVKKTQQMISTPLDGKILTEGRGEGYSTVIRRIIIAMDALHLEKRESDLHPDTILEFIKFTNFGSEADSSTDIIPSSALNFIRNALRYNLGEEILELINNEQPRKASNGHKKKTGFHPKNMLINRLLRYEDYRPLYPRTIQIEDRSKKGKIEKHPLDLPGASSELFSLYQSSILGVSTKSLNSAWRIADHIHKNTKLDELEYVRKDTENDRDKQAMIKKFMVKMVEEGKLSFNDYAELFLTTDRVPRINYHAWRILHYYLHNQDRKPVLDISIEKPSRYEKTYDSWKIFNRIIDDKGREWFQKNILNAFAHAEVNTEWLRKQYVKSARLNGGFTYEDWKYLCVDNEGKERTTDLLFSLRLLFTEWFYGKGTPPIQSNPITKPDKIPLDTDLNDSIKDIIKSIVDKYLDKYGPEKFQKQILHQLIVNWRESVYWFKRKLKLSDQQWQEFTTDNNDIKNLRRFQLQLELNNAFRKSNN
jgi:hypothetical protein